MRLRDIQALTTFPFGIFDNTKTAKLVLFTGLPEGADSGFGDDKTDQGPAGVRLLSDASPAAAQQRDLTVPHHGLTGLKHARKYENYWIMTDNVHADFERAFIFLSTASLPRLLSSPTLRNMDGLNKSFTIELNGSPIANVGNNAEDKTQAKTGSEAAIFTLKNGMLQNGDWVLGRNLTENRSFMPKEVYWFKSGADNDKRVQPVVAHQDGDIIELKFGGSPLMLEDSKIFADMLGGCAPISSATEFGAATAKVCSCDSSIPPLASAPMHPASAFAMDNLTLKALTPAEEVKERAKLDVRFADITAELSNGPAQSTFRVLLKMRIRATPSPSKGRRGLGRFFTYFQDEENWLRVKLDCFLLLWMFVAGIMKEMDQSATTQAYVSGMKEDLALYGNELNWFQTYFSIAYAIFIVPSQMLQTRLRPSLWLPFAEIAWGILTLFTYKAKTATTIYILRFFLGALSATSWPGITSLIMTWYTPSELALRLAIFNVSDVAGAMFLGVVQAELYVNMNGVNGLAGWQWLFIVSGAITILLGFLGLFIVPDSPANTRAIWLTKREKELSRERLRRHGVQAARLIPLEVLRTKLLLLVKHPLTFLYIAAFAQNAWAHRANSYILLYLKDITDPAGNKLYTTHQVNLIPLGGYGLQILTNVGINALGDWKGWRWPIFVGSGLVHIVACGILSGWPASHPTIMFAYFLTYATNAGGPALIAWLAELLRVEPEARAIIVGMSVTIVYVGHATIPLGAWKAVDAPHYSIGFPLALSFAAGAIVLVLVMRFWFVEHHPDFAKEGYSSDKVTEEHLDMENVSERLDAGLAEQPSKVGLSVH
ncbi:hypothetical protein OPT61_g1195 [Boeremia exigua]|uniref:Uncharacterized protein n=1 Tax=Boeremia exigua TaxID=749465 RepID=A0ACC2IRC0_9PLEO|nr:hypothetical protein OPT61_g1195 [Boeremia exigua]